jgi:hypothetical protein
MALQQEKEHDYEHDVRMGDRAVDCARLESVCAERHRGFESPPIRHALKLPSLRRKVKVRVKVSSAGRRRIGPVSTP